MVLHLQFADDTLIFCPAKRKTLTNIRRDLDCFQILSGLKINFSKSGLIVLGKNSMWTSQMASKLGCNLVELPITYLGIPLANTNKLATWKPVIEKVRKKLASWKSGLLSKAGRLVLIKSVLNSIPLYYMSLFKVPKLVVKQIIKAQRNFFWTGSENRKGLRPISWNLIQRPKSLGGLGVDDLIIKIQPFYLSGGGDFLRKESPYGRGQYVKYIIWSLTNLFSSRKIKGEYEGYHALKYQFWPFKAQYGPSTLI